MNFWKILYIRYLNINYLKPMPLLDFCNIVFVVVVVTISLKKNLHFNTYNYTDQVHYFQWNVLPCTSFTTKSSPDNKPIWTLEFLKISYIKTILIHIFYGFSFALKVLNRTYTAAVMVIYGMVLKTIASVCRLVLFYEQILFVMPNKNYENEIPISNI